MTPYVFVSERLPLHARPERPWFLRSCSFEKTSCVRRLHDIVVHRQWQTKIRLRNSHDCAHVIFTLRDIAIVPSKTIGEGHAVALNGFDHRGTRQFQKRVTTPRFDDAVAKVACFTTPSGSKCSIQSVFEPLKHSFCTRNELPQAHRGQVVTTRPSCTTTTSFSVSIACHIRNTFEPISSNRSSKRRAQHRTATRKCFTQSPPCQSPERLCVQGE